MNPIVWVAGSLRNANEPVLSATDHGVTVGDGAFETIHIRDGQPFALTRHLLRLQRSTDRLGIEAPHPSAVQAGIDAVMAAGEGQLTRLRVTVTSGDGPMSSVRGDGPLSLIVTGGNSPAPATCHAVRAPWVRNERSALAGVKSTSYGENAVMADYARSKGADEALIANTVGHLCEGTATNVFVERGGEILTPPLTSGCLAGITRALALEWGADAGLLIRVAQPGELTMAVLDSAVAHRAHIAVTSSTRGVQHLQSLDGNDLVPGPLLGRLSELYEHNAQQDVDPDPRD